MTEQKKIKPTNLHHVNTKWFEPQQPKEPKESKK